MRAFVCVEISHSVYNIINEIRESLRLRETPIKAENLHFTLAFLGNIDSPDEIMEALRKIKVKSFNITLSGLGAFPSVKNPRILWMGTSTGSESLVALASGVQNSLQKINYSSDKRFKPHLTIFRIKRGTNLIGKLNKYANSTFHSEEVVKFKLKQSVLDSNGAIYSDLGEVRLE